MAPWSRLSAFNCSSASRGGMAASNGLPWADHAGRPINAHGGGLLLSGGTVFWYGEHKNRGSDAVARDGVHCYSCADLFSAPASPVWCDQGLAFDLHRPEHAHLRGRCILERPKVTEAPDGRFVMWFHLEDDCGDDGNPHYGAAKVGVATSASPSGPFVMNGPGFRPCGAMSRDLTIFQEGCSAWLVSASEENQTLHVYQLAEPGFERVLMAEEYEPDHPARAAEGWDDNGFVRIFPGRSMEAPAIARSTLSNQLWMVASGCTGWDPNEARSAVAKSIWGPWIERGNPCEGVLSDARWTFHAQSTFLLPVPHAPGQFVFLADRWNPEDHALGVYIWVPAVECGDRLSILWRDSAAPASWLPVAPPLPPAGSFKPEGVPPELWHCSGAVCTQTCFLRTLSSQASAPGALLHVNPRSPASPVSAEWNDKGAWQQLRFVHRPDCHPWGQAHGVGGEGFPECSIWSRRPVYILAEHVEARRYLDVEGDAVAARFPDQGPLQAMELSIEGAAPDGQVPLRFGDVVRIRSLNTGKHLEVEGTRVRARWDDPGGDYQRFVVLPAA